MVTQLNQSSVMMFNLNPTWLWPLPPACSSAAHHSGPWRVSMETRTLDYSMVSFTLIKAAQWCRHRKNGSSHPWSMLSVVLQLFTNDNGLNGSNCDWLVRTLFYLWSIHSDSSWNLLFGPECVTWPSCNTVWKQQWPSQHHTTPLPHPHTFTTSNPRSWVPLTRTINWFLQNLFKPNRKTFQIQPDISKYDENYHPDYIEPMKHDFTCCKFLSQMLMWWWFNGGVPWSDRATAESTVSLL